MTTSHAEHSDRVARIHREMARHRAACGCELGSVFALAATVGFTAYVVAGRGAWPWPETLLRGLGWVVAVSVAGKLIGLLHARIRLAMLAAELHHLSPVHHTPTPSTAGSD